MDYRVICTTQEPAHVPHTAAHIVTVGTGLTTSHYDQQWTVAEVYRAMDTGHRFYTQSPSTGQIAFVRKWNCSCGRPTLRSNPDAVSDNNLDNLPACG